jgi:hypothetical protein
LKALIAGEVARLKQLQTETLEPRDRELQAAALSGLPMAPDEMTRRLRSDQARAQRRLAWARDALRELQNGSDPATMIDPDTHRPIQPERRGRRAKTAPATPAEHTTREAPAPTTEAPPPPPTPAEPEPSPPEGVEIISTEEMLEMIRTGQAEFEDFFPPEPIPPGFEDFIRANPPPE